MNQDNYLGEAYKMRNLLEGFSNVRIIGFREHIFSESGGAVASFAANNEFVFGTMVQRFGVALCVRFHYGHPDVWDKVWVTANGGVSRPRARCTSRRTSLAGSTRCCAAARHLREYLQVGKWAGHGLRRRQRLRAEDLGGQRDAAHLARSLSRRQGGRPLPAALDVLHGHGLHLSTMITIWSVSPRP